MSILTIPTSKKIHIATSGSALSSVVYESLLHKKTSLEERVTILLLRDLVRLGWRLRTNSKKYFELAPPIHYEKTVIKEAMAYLRNEIIERNEHWIKKIWI